MTSPLTIEVPAAAPDRDYLTCPLVTEVIRIDPRRLVLLEVNARFMRHETFNRLTANVKGDGDLTQVPFAAILGYTSPADPIPRFEDGLPKLEVLSGNHRVQSAIAAGMSEIWLQITLQPVPRKRRIAIQLSHNAITGEDDPSVLKQLYSAIDDVDMKLYSGLDDKKLGLIEDVKSISLSEANLSFQNLSVVFLPDEMAEARQVIEEAVKSAKSADSVWLARMSEYDKWLDSVESAGSANGVKNAATAIAAVLAVFRRHQTDLAAAWADEESSAIKPGSWVPLVSFLGTDKVPVGAARVIQQCIQRMTKQKLITDKAPWQAFELLAADFLAGK